jgi:plastocyanin
MNRWLKGALAVLLLGSLVYPGLSVGYEATSVANGGTIVGEVKYAGDPPPPEKVAVTKDEKVCGTEPKNTETLIVGSDKGVQNAVVFLADIQKGKAQEKLPKNPVLDQKQCQYHPHAQIAPAGSTLDIMNNDDVLHNIKTEPGSKTSFNVAQPKFKKKIEMKLDTPEMVKVECNVHGWMKAILVVTPNPYYVLTDANGSFKITDVPPGKYTLKVWHEKLGEQTKEVTVNPNEEVKLAFEMKSV